ncbi:hypothetical protein [Candidatus Chloroploca asiatica]|uniref:hypothetical protein n=1 Tax=Candidatus Chloroploca asiatica TaxID=1506545 RepID=UPI00114242C2|nr:hypothetical protein [Candidatus Chloroploca asiatica]
MSTIPSTRLKIVAQQGPKALIAASIVWQSTSVYAVQAMLAQRPEATRLILYLHDGVPTDEPAAMVSATVATVRRQGTLVVGVYVGPQEHLERLEGIFGAADTLPVARLREVPQALGRVLQRAAATRRLGRR